MNHIQIKITLLNMQKNKKKSKTHIKYTSATYYLRTETTKNPRIIWLSDDYKKKGWTYAELNLKNEQIIQKKKLFYE